MIILQEVLHIILQKEGFRCSGFSTLHGGSINEVYVLDTDRGSLAVKINQTHLFPGMFEKEVKGLQLLLGTNTFRLPKVICYGESSGYSYLLLEFITSASRKPTFWEDFGQQLAKLHQTTQLAFGLDHDNYIGSLPQYNSCQLTDAAQFYIEQRLEPQFKLAVEKGYSFNNLSGFYKNIQAEIPDEPPALIHGDLWNGNYLVDGQGNPCLIDPAVAFAPREMDLAMMQLFGGFPEKVFAIYDVEFSLEKNWKNRMDLWQLYYLLVHLNLFGSGYYNSVHTILKKYS